MCIVGLTGCDKVQQFDKMKSDLADTKKQVESLKFDMSKLDDRLLANEAYTHNLYDEKKTSESNQFSNKLAPQEIEEINKAVQTCVTNVHEISPDNPFYQNFDAYYNTATGKVQNSARTNFEMPPQFAFSKCMVSQGFPLKDSL